MPSPVKIKGAGIKGLALAFFLKQKGISSIIYEKSARAGGWIRTFHHEGFLFEAGPRSFRASLVTLEMIKALGLEQELMVPDVKKRYVLHNGKLRSTAYFLPRLGLGLLRDLITPKCFEEMSVEAYFKKRLGNYCTQTLIDPLTSGIFGGDISKLSAQGCFPSMTAQGSILRSQWREPKLPLFTFKQGMQTLVDALAREQDIRFSTTIAHADFDCTPSTTYTYTSLVAINLGWHEKVLGLQGFGYLVPQKEKQAILGVVFDHIDPAETRLTVMMGGAHHPSLIALPDHTLLEIALSALKKHLRIYKSPAAFYITRACNAIPQPLMGHSIEGIGVNGAILHAHKLACCRIYK